MTTLVLVHLALDDLLLTVQVQPKLLYWSSPALRKRLLELENRGEKTSEDNQTVLEIRAALKWVESEYSHMSVGLETMKTEGKITFEYLWALLPPNVLVLSKEDVFNQDRLYRVRRHSLERTQNGVILALDSQYTDSNGKTLGHVATKLSIPNFEGAVPITSLPFYPLECHPDAPSICQKLLARGKAQLAYHKSGHQFREYSGFGLKQADNGILKFKASFVFLLGRRRS
jgi:hypothetical protein